MKRLIILLLGLFIVILNTGCSSTNIKGETHKNFSNPTTENAVYRVQVDKNIEHIIFNLDAKIEKGEFKFTINDPSGKVYWSKSTDKDTRGFDIDFNIKSPKKGDWEIIFELDDAIGEYWSSWEAN